MFYSLLHFAKHVILRIIPELLFICVVEYFNNNNNNSTQSLHYVDNYKYYLQRKDISLIMEQDTLVPLRTCDSVAYHMYAHIVGGDKKNPKLGLQYIANLTLRLESLNEIYNKIPY